MAVPLTASLRNPIFEREFVALCRTKRWFVMRTLLVASLTFATAVVMSTEAANSDEVGRILFGTGTIVQVAFVFFLTSALCSDLIVSERRRETLDVILTTPLLPLSIVLGKLFSRLSLLVVIIGASFPLIAISLLYGGVSGRQVVGLFEISLGTMLMTAGPALLISTYARRLGTAAILSQMLPLAWCFLVPFALALAAGGHFDDTVEILALCHPLVTALELMDTHPVASPLVPMFSSTGFLLFGAGVSALAVLFAVRRLRRERTGQTVRGGNGEAAEPAPVARHDPARLRENLRTSRIVGVGPTRRLTPEAVRGPSRRRSRRRFLFRSLANPVLWKEMNLINASTSRVLFWLVAVLLVIGEALVLLTANVSYALAEPGLHIGAACSAAFVLMLLAVVNAATSIVSEREQGTLELLHVTPLRPGQILFGKAAGVFRSVGLLSLIPVVHLAAAAAVTRLTIGAFFAFALAYTLLIGYFTVVGLRYSMQVTRPSRAIVRALLHFAGLMVGYPIALGILGALGLWGDSSFGLLMFNPIALLAGATTILQEGSGKEVEFLLPWTLGAFAFYFAVTLFRSFRLGSLYRRNVLGRPSPEKRRRRVQ